jgi:hypothetical protein
VNQVLHGICVAGGCDWDDDGADYAGPGIYPDGVTAITAELRLRIPPILGSCNPGQTLRMAVGDLSIKVLVTRYGQPMEALLYTSFSCPVDGVIEDGVDGRRLVLALGAPDDTEVEVASLSEGLEDLEDLIAVVTRDMVIPGLAKHLGREVFAGLPPPGLDLGPLFGAQPPPGQNPHVVLEPAVTSYASGETLAGGPVH